MAILPEEVERLVVVDIQNVNANLHIHGKVVLVLVLLHINMIVVEPDIVEVVGQLVVDYMKVVAVLLDMCGMVGLVNKVVLSV